MPSIPLAHFTPQASPSQNVRADPGMFSAQAAAGVRLGNAIAGLGDVATDMAAKMQAADDYRAKTTMDTAMDEEWAKFQAGLNPSSDQTKWTEQWQKQLDARVAKEAPKSASASLKLELEAKTKSYRVHSSGQIALQAKANGVEKGMAAGKARAMQLWDNGDAEGAQSNYEQMAAVGLIHAEQIPALMQEGQQRMEQNHANTLIESDPFAATEMLKAKGEDGKYTNLTNIPASQRQTLLFRANKAMTETRSATQRELLQAKADALNGAGDMPKREDVEAIAKKQGISPKWVDTLYKPEAKFDATDFAVVRSQVLSYDPASDGNGMKYAEAQEAIYDAHLPPQAQSELLADLKKKADPKSELNTPVAKEAGQIIDENFRLGIYGKFETRTQDPKTLEWKTVINPTVLAAAQQRRAQSQTALAKWLTDHPEGTHAEAQAFLNTQTKSARAASLWAAPVDVNTGKAKK